MSLPDARSGQECIGAATAAVAEGPYSGVGEGPLLCQHEMGGSIDPAVTRDRAGKLHMLWKNDGNAMNVPSSIWEQAPTDDGLGVVGPNSFWRAKRPRYRRVSHARRVAPSTAS